MWGADPLKGRLEMHRSSVEDSIAETIGDKKPVPAGYDTLETSV